MDESLFYPRLAARRSGGGVLFIDPSVAAATAGFVGRTGAAAVGAVARSIGVVIMTSAHRRASSGRVWLG